MHYTCILINIAAVFIPLILSFDKKLNFIHKWKFVLPAVLFTAATFLIWNVLFVKLNVWSFNPDYILGFDFLGLPVEWILFLITIPCVCLFIYEWLNEKFPNTSLQKYSFSLSNLILGICVAILFFGYSKWYALINVGFLFVVLAHVEYVNVQHRFMYKFYRAYLVSLIPFYVINGFLTFIPVVLYNKNQILGFKLGSIPFEDHFYLMAFFLMNVYFYEIFKSKALKVENI